MGRMLEPRWPLFGALVLFMLVIAQPALAVCALGWVEGPSLLQRASLRLAGGAVPAGTVRIEYLGHSSFVVESPAGATVVTDFNGFVAPSFVPDIVMMNNAHETHYTDYPDPRIKFVLRGWRPGGGIAAHNLKYKDMRVRNVPTNVGELGDPRSNNNSVFVIEVAGLCIAHLGHLHHVLTRDQLMLLGRIDALFVPVDGGMTMSHAQALANIKLIDPRW